MNRTNKAELATVLKDKFSKANVAVFADYKGLTAVQADELRRKLRLHKAEVRVLKNNVARLVTKDGSFGSDAQSVMDSVVGPTLVAFAFGDPAATAKVIHEFCKDNEALRLKDSLLGNKKILASDVQALASLPSREVLIAQLLGVMNGPARGFVSVLAAVPRGLVTVLAAVQKKKEDSA
jgi:large subunit ribosomal protein L10